MSGAGEQSADVRAAGAEASAVAAAEAAAIVTAAAELEAARAAREAEESLEEHEEDLERTIELWHAERNALLGQVAALEQALSALPTVEQVTALLTPLLDKLAAMEMEITELKTPSRPAVEVIQEQPKLETPPQNEGEGARQDQEPKPQRFRLL